MTIIHKLITLTAALTCAAFGQVSKSQGYIFQGFGGSWDNGSGLVGHTGGGGEGVFWKGVSVGGEIGGAYPIRCFTCIIGVANANGGFHFNAGRADRKVEAFVSAGYSFFFRGDSANGFNYGGGINYWFKPHIGLRLEVRDYRIERYHAFTQFRIGLSFR